MVIKQVVAIITTTHHGFNNPKFIPKMLLTSLFVGDILIDLLHVRYAQVKSLTFYHTTDTDDSGMS